MAENQGRGRGPPQLNFGDDNLINKPRTKLPGAEGAATAPKPTPEPANGPSSDEFKRMDLRRNNLYINKAIGDE